MPRVKNGLLLVYEKGIGNMCSMKCASFLSGKLRRIRREIGQAAIIQEEIRQSFLDMYAEKDEDGNRMTEIQIVDGIPVMGDNGKPKMDVIFADLDGFKEAMVDHLNTEIDIVEFVTEEDIEDPRHPDGFFVSADELDALGPLYIDSKQIILRVAGESEEEK